MGKKYLTLAATAAVLSQVCAGSLTEYQARDIAARYIKNPATVKMRPASIRQDNTTAQKAKPSGERENVWLFSGTGGKGFVIVANSDCDNPVVGYSRDGQLSADNMPDALRDCLRHIAAYGPAIRPRQSKVSGDDNPSQSTIIVDALIKTRWDQLKPYNSLLPFSMPVYTGCPATAMAQVMNYHRWPQSGRGTYSYHLANDGIDTVLTTDFSQSTYDWNNMSATYVYENGEPAWTNAQADAVATLMRDCGMAVNMLYGRKSSGSVDNEWGEALSRYFGYETAGYNIWNTGYDSLMRIVRHELDNGFPVLMSGCPTLELTGGHVFIADGYDSDGFLHINWGWSGNSDGFYNPGFFNLTGFEGDFHSGGLKITTAHPIKEDKEEHYFAYTSICNPSADEPRAGLFVDSPVDGETSEGGDIAVRLLNVQSAILREFTGTLAVGIFSEDDKLISVTASQPLHFSAESNATFPHIDFDIQFPVTSIASLPDGTYTLHPMTRRQELEEYSKMAVYTTQPKLTLSVRDGKFRIENRKQGTPDIHITAVNAPGRIPMLSKAVIEIRMENRSDIADKTDIKASLKSTDGRSWSLEPLYHPAIIYEHTNSVYRPIYTVRTDIPCGRYTLEISADNTTSDIAAMPEIEIYKDPLTSLDYTITSSSYSLDSWDDGNADTVYSDTITVNSTEDLFGIKLNLPWQCSLPIMPHTVNMRGTVSNQAFKDTEEDFNTQLSSSFNPLDITISEFHLPTKGSTDIDLEFFDPLTDKWKPFLGHNKLHLKVNDATGIHVNGNRPATETARYDTAGRKLRKPARGLNIVRYSDGSIRKTVVE